MRFRLTVQVAKLRRTSHPRPSPLLFCSPLVDSTYPLKEKVKTLVGAQGDEHHCSGVGVMSKFKCSAVPVQELSKHSVRLSVDDISFQFKTSHVADGRTDGRTDCDACLSSTLGLSYLSAVRWECFCPSFPPLPTYFSMPLLTSPLRLRHAHRNATCKPIRLFHYDGRLRGYDLIHF